MHIKALEVGPFASNCFIVSSEKTRRGIIIDPGTEPETILKTVKDQRLDIVTIVVTHSHTDHVGAVREVKEATKAEFVVHKDDANFNLPEHVNRMLQGMTGKRYEPPPDPDRLLVGGDIIEVDDLKFTVIHTPGHTPGGICLLGDGVVFTGDTLFNYGIGRTDMPGGSTAKIMDSITTRLMTLPDNTVVYPGHGPDSTIGRERAGNPFLRPGGFGW